MLKILGKELINFGTYEIELITCQVEFLGILFRENKDWIENALETKLEGPRDDLVNIYKKGLSKRFLGLL